MKQEYFVVYFGEDGMSIRHYNKQQLEKLINDINDLTEESSDPFVKEAPREFYMDGGEYPVYKYLILKGEVVIPRPVEVVKKYEI